MDYQHLPLPISNAIVHVRHTIYDLKRPTPDRLQLRRHSGLLYRTLPEHLIPRMERAHFGGDVVGGTAVGAAVGDAVGAAGDTVGSGTDRLSASGTTCC